LPATYSAFEKGWRPTKTFGFGIGWGKVITLSPRLIQWLVRKIPQLYRGEPVFYRMVQGFTSQTKQKRPSLQQLLKKMRRGERKKSRRKPAKRLRGR
jgi:hypothetical protein